MTGIWGAGDVGAQSIVVSGGYEDDEDLGNLIIYTGQGGRDPASGRQVADRDTPAATPVWCGAVSMDCRFASCAGQAAIPCTRPRRVFDTTDCSA